jgi:hypothetical protein|tara:strand:+ start:97 stop:672 length:576 start_codon:yes stop_codon:yes gene_type:complete
MNIALPILLLVFGGLTLWTLTESTLKWYLKTACISSFCIFTIIFWSSISTFLGWAAHEDDVPDKVLIHWIIIKEPNKFTKSKGKIYVLLEAANEKEPNKFIKFFGYKKDKVEPRLYGLTYSRKLHEQLEKRVMPRLRKGQPVVGKLTKREGEGKKGNEKGPNNKKGGGSESQEQEWQFHELRPSDIHSKPE